MAYHQRTFKTAPAAHGQAKIMNPAQRLAAGSAPSNPLQLTQWLYLAQDLAVITDTASGTTLSQITVTESVSGSGDNNSYTFDFSTPSELSNGVPPFDQILAATVVNNSTTGCQELAILAGSAGTASSLVLVASQGSGGSSSLGMTPFPFTDSSLQVQVVIDYLPTGTTTSGDTQAQMGPLLLAGSSGSTISLFTLDSTTSSFSGPWTIVCEDEPSLVGGYLLRFQMEIWIVLLGIEGTTLKTYAVPAAGLTAAAGPLVAPTEATLGTIASGSNTAAKVVQSVPNDNGQQLAVTFFAQQNVPTLATVAFDQNGDPTVVCSAGVLTSFIDSVEVASIRIAAADFQSIGADQIVVGFPAIYDNVDGCLALSLFSWDTSQKSLEQQSNFVCIAPDNAPLTSIDFHISAGIFWAGGPTNGTLGVAVIGCGASMGDLLQGIATISIDIIPVTPSSPPAFPPFTTSPSALVSPLAITVPDTVTSIMGLGIDFSGLSVVLGPPTIQQVDQYDQILAIICSPPFDAKNNSSLPALTFGQNQTTTSSVSVTSDKNWTSSNEVSTNLNVGNFAWANTLTNTYGNEFNLTNDNSTTTGVNISTEFQETDMMVVYGTSYTAWQYPIYQVSNQQGNIPAGHILVVFPNQAQSVQQVVPAYDPNLTFGYQQLYENGTLLSYFGLLPDGYNTSDPTEMLFETINVAVTTETDGTSITYDSTKMLSNTVGVSKNVTTNLSNSNGLTLATNLFSFLPASFGLNVTNSSSYSDTSTNNTSLSYTDDLSIQIQFGAVPDASLEYSVMPLIYQHPVLGCMVIAYQVTDLAPGWNSAYGAAKPMLVRPFRSSTDLLLSGFSPCISFSTPDSGLQIDVVVFNCGFTQADNVVCTAYIGVPDTSQGSLAPPTGGTAIGSPITVPTIGAVERQTISIPWADATQNQAITVAIEMGGQVMDIGWIAYPQSASSTFVTGGPS